MLLRMSLMILGILLLTACSSYKPEKEIVTVEKIIKPQIQVVERPKPVQMNDIKFYVVTEQNLDAFIERFGKENGEIVFYSISVRDYENMAVNLGELRRYIEQQNSVILYYETAVNPPIEEKPVE